MRGRIIGADESADDSVSARHLGETLEIRRRFVDDKT